MAEIDKQKEKITFFRNLFFFLLASLFGLIAFIFNKYKNLTDWELLIVNIGGFILLVSIILTGIKLKKEINKIGEIK